MLIGATPQEAEAVPPEVFAQCNQLCRDIGARTISLHVAMGNYDGANRVAPNWWPPN